MKKAFDHIGIFTSEPQEGESWVPDSQVWVTNPRLHPGRIEYLRASAKPAIPREQDGLWKLWNWPHIAYRVDDLREAIAAAGAIEHPERLVLGPFRPAPFVEAAFVHEHGVIVEYLQYAELDHWFGQPNPPEFRHEPLI